MSQFNTPAKVESHAGLMRRALHRNKVTAQTLDRQTKLLRRGSSVVGGLNGPLTSLTSDLALGVASDKWATKLHFESARVPHPHGRSFVESELSAAKQYVAASGGLFAVKAVKGMPSQGIALRVGSADELTEAWGAAATSSLDAAPHRRILVERFHEGLDLRLYVVGEVVASAVVRVPFYIVGDGSSTVSDLYAEALVPRARHAHLSGHTPALADLSMGRADLRGATVLPQGAYQSLSEGTSIRAGAIAVDVTDDLSDSFSDLAVEAAYAVPGLTVAGIDLLAPDLGSAEGAIALEVNVNANFMPHAYPALGKSRDVAAAVVSLMLARSRV